LVIIPNNSDKITRKEEKLMKKRNDKKKRTFFGANIETELLIFLENDADINSSGNCGQMLEKILRERYKK